MNALLVAGLILGIGAPAPKDAPKKGPALPSIVGMWEAQKRTLAGIDLPDEPMLFEFRADGQLNMTHVEQAWISHHRHNFDASKDPAELDWLKNGEESKTVRAIYMIDGAILTLCFENTFNGNRPTRFESVKGTKTLIWTLKRVEKKKE